jgi:hypothetical protein
MYNRTDQKTPVRRGERVWGRGKTGKVCLKDVKEMRG